MCDLQEWHADTGPAHTRASTSRSIIFLNRWPRVADHRRSAIVLSGTGSDGTAGLRAIKAAGGLTFAQTADRESSIRCRTARFVPVLSMLFCRRTQSRAKSSASPTIRTSGVRWPIAQEDENEAYRQADDLGRIFLSLKKYTGVDFSAYKHSTLESPDSPPDGAASNRTAGPIRAVLRNNKKEVEALFADLLINVTRFFRDKGCSEP